MGGGRSEVNINIGMQAKGRVKTTLTDIRTGKKEIHEQDNLLLNSFMNEWFTGYGTFLSASTMSACFLDTSNTPADPNQTGVQGSTLASNTNGVTVFSETPWNEGKLPNLSTLPSHARDCSFSPDGKYLAVAYSSARPYITVYRTEKPKTTTAQKMKRKWTFPPGTGTGEISSLVLRTSTANVWTSRVALDFPINKTEFHELEVEWEIELFFDFETEVMIPSGQIDGETDVKVTIELSPHFTHQISSLSGHRKWLQTTSPALLLGRRNTPYGGIPTIQGLQGEQVARYTNSNIREAQPYISGSLERTTRIFLETNQGNDYPIAEMVLEDFCRLRFDPPLEKDDMHRLYIDLTFKWNRGE